MKTRGLLLLFLLSSQLCAQRGIAPSGYYPRDFRGDTFTGKVITSDSTADTLTLEYKDGAKAELLSVNFEGGCYVPSKTGEPMHAKNISPGSVLKVLYVPKVVKKSSKKKQVNFTVGISFIEWQGKPVPEDRRIIHRCGPKGGFLHYRAFDRRPGAASLSPLELTIPNE